MADGRKEGAKKGWDTRRARVRVVADTPPHVTLQEAEKVYQDDAFESPGWWASFIRWWRHG